jgi:hypothetical protein
MASHVQATVVRWADDDPFPGTVEVQLVDGLGRIWKFIDKWPMFGSDDVSPTSIFPLEITLPVTIVRHDDNTVTVSTAAPCMVETVTASTNSRCCFPRSKTSNFDPSPVGSDRATRPIEVQPDSGQCLVPELARRPSDVNPPLQTTT